MNLENQAELQPLTTERMLQQNLYGPADELGARPSKAIRSQLLGVGYSFIATELESRSCQELAILGEAIEEVHRGSLIIDDIQDQSSERRGGPCVHQIYGVPLAINAGNWLYFKALDRIADLPLDSDKKLSLYKTGVSVLQAAHVGQALDIGTDMALVDWSEIPALVQKSLFLKSGQLTACALAYGAILAGGTEESVRSVFEMGCDFGVHLQVFDDIGNFRMLALENPANYAKHLEDLRLRRPSFLWSFIARGCSPAEQTQFLNIVKDLAQHPENTQELLQFVQGTGCRQRARAEAIEQWSQFKVRWQKHWFNPAQLSAWNGLIQLGDSLVHAYE